MCKELLVTVSVAWHSPDQPQQSLWCDVWRVTPDTWQCRVRSGNCVANFNTYRHLPSQNKNSVLTRIFWTATVPLFYSFQIVFQSWNWAGSKSRECIWNQFYCPQTAHKITFVSFQLPSVFCLIDIARDSKWWLGQIMVNPRHQPLVS